MLCMRITVTYGRKYSKTVSDRVEEIKRRSAVDCISALYSRGTGFES